MYIPPLFRKSRFRNGINEASNLKPFRTASLISVLYIVMLSIYIWWSGIIAVNLSNSVQSLESIELAKGLVFTFASGAGLFCFTYITFRKIADKDSVIISQNKSIISSERLVMAGIFSSSVCHDINNIMSIIIGNTELISQNNGIDDKNKRALAAISEASYKLVTLSKRMMDSGKGYIPGEKKLEEITSIIKDTIEFAKIHKSVKHCHLHYSLPQSLYIHLNASLFSRALMNLILNASEASGGKGEIFIKLTKGGKQITVDVHDSGHGISDGLAKRIFEPFFTSKEDGNGLGLLSLRLCADHHAGSIGLSDSHLSGACFSISLPLER